MQVQNISWDDQKNEINIKKHGFSFYTAVKVFDDPNRIEDYDDFHSTDEDRFRTIGMIDNVVCVVYTVRDDRIRLITARYATKKERRLYYAGNDSN